MANVMPMTLQRKEIEEALKKSYYTKAFLEASQISLTCNVKNIAIMIETTRVNSRMAKSV